MSVRALRLRRTAAAGGIGGRGGLGACVFGHRVQARTRDAGRWRSLAFLQLDERGRGRWDVGVDAAQADMLLRRKKLKVEASLGM